MPRWGLTQDVLRDLPSLLTECGLGRATAISEIDEGFNNWNLLVTTPRGKFVVKRYISREANDVSFDVEVLAHLRDAGFPVPAPIPAGELLVGELSGKPAAVFEFIEGAHPGLSWGSSAAAWMAKLHVLTVGYRPSASKSWGELSEIHRANDFAEDFARLGYHALLEDVALLEAEWSQKVRELADSLPTGLIHGDPYPGNMLIQDDDLVALLDWDTSCIGRLVLDVAETCIRWAAPSLDLDVAVVEQVVRSYETVRNLTPEELDALPVALRVSTLGSAVQWLSGKIGSPHPPHLDSCGSYQLFKSVSRVMT